MLTVASFGGLEAVSGAAHGFQVTRVFGVGLDFFADASDINVDGAWCDVGGVAPDGVKKVVAAEDASLVAGEVIEETEFRGGGGNRIAAHREGHGRRIDLDLSNFQGTGRQRALETAQHSFNASDEFSRTEGLSNVVVGAEFETENAIGLAAFGGQENHGDGRQAGSLPDGAANFETVFAGHHDVEDEKSGALTLGVGEYVGPGGIDADREAFVFQMMTNQSGNVGIVFDDEQTWFHGDIVAGIK